MHRWRSRAATSRNAELLGTITSKPPPIVRCDPVALAITLSAFAKDAPRHPQSRAPAR
jgi:hypothetical protein